MATGVRAGEGFTDEAGSGVRKMTDGRGVGEFAAAVGDADGDGDGVGDPGEPLGDGLGEDDARGVRVGEAVAVCVACGSGV